MLKAIFADYMGTLVDEDSPYVKQVIAGAYRGSSCKSPAEAANRWFQLQDEMLLHANGEDYRLQREIAGAAFVQAKKLFGFMEKPEVLAELLEKHWINAPAYEDARVFLDQCPLPVYVLTNNDTKYLEASLANNKLHPAGIITSEMARAYKPRKEIFEYALRLCGCTPVEVVHVGDSLRGDVAGARAAGIEPWLLDRKGARQETGVRTFKDLLEILDEITKRAGI